MQRNDLLCWMDLEMTSLVDASHDSIIELAVVLTDKDLNIVAEGPDLVIHTEPEAFEGIPESARKVHEHSGIIEKAIVSRISEREAEEQVLAFLKEHITPESAPLCGNSIHMDRHFLRLRMRELNDYLFYRCIDVSTLKELARRWAPEVYEEAERCKGDAPHQAKGDILKSVEELRFYREHFLKS